ncbi:MAG: RIP metalloprotease RseP [Cytophagales bacterium]|nr:RIP metalloprotease RseP [Cytophagales bacterium]
MGTLIMILQFVTALLTIVSIHEYGHLVAAKYFGMRVEQYSLGFPPRLFGFRYKGTEYTLGLIPLGGFVKIAGMGDEFQNTDGADQAPPKDWEFRAKPAWQRLIVVLGGIILNVISGVLIFSCLTYLKGEEFLPSREIETHGIVAHELAEKVGLRTGDRILSINGRPYQRFEDLLRPDFFLSDGGYYELSRNGSRLQVRLPENFLGDLSEYAEKGESFISPRMPFRVGEIPPSSPVAGTGLEDGDIFQSIEGKEVQYFDQFQEALKTHSGDSIQANVIRDAQPISIRLPVREDGKLGIHVQSTLQFSHQRYSIPGSLYRGAERAFILVWTHAKGLSKLIRGDISPQKSLTGPIGMAKLFGMHWDWSRFWYLVGLLSMVLAFMNILPIPALDGGHALFCCYEVIVGKAPPARFLKYAQQAGMIFLLTLIAFVIFNDLIKIWF